MVRNGTGSIFMKSMLLTPGRRNGGLRLACIGEGVSHL